MKSLGQLEYEEWRDKQRTEHDRLWPDWEFLMPEQQGEWNLIAAIFGRKYEG